MTRSLPFIFLIFGFLLIAVEIFLVPGITFFGIMRQRFAFHRCSFYAFFEFSLTTAFLYLLLALATVILLVAWFLKKGIHLGFSLKNKEAAAEGFKPYVKNYEQYLNKEGIAHTYLRPSGFIKIDGEKVEATSQGDFIKEGEKIRVIKVEGNKLIVIKIIKKEKTFYGSFFRNFVYCFIFHHYYSYSIFFISFLLDCGSRLWRPG